MSANAMRVPDVPKVSFAGAKVLVTGGAGFIGSRIVELLAPLGCRDIVVIDNMVRGRLQNLSTVRDHAPLHLVRGDIRDRALMRDLMEGVDIVFHQAALRITHCAEEPRAAMDVMVQATYDLLEDCVSNRVRKVVMASSASVYGLAETFPTAEAHHAYANRTLYGAAKAFAEGLLRSFNDMYGLDYVALRYFNAYGPRMDIHGRYTEVLIRWMERIEQGQPPVIFGDGSQTMDFVHVDDIARANVLAAAADVSDVVLNVGSRRETSLTELAQALAAVMGRPDLGPSFAAERAVNPVRRRLADVTAARQLLGFEASVPLDEGLRGLVAWWLENRPESARQAVEVVS